MHVELVLEVDQALVSDVSDTLMEAGALAATIEDADAGTEQEVPLYDEPGEVPGGAWPKSVLIALFDAHADLDAATARVVHPGDSRVRLIGRRDVLTEDWVRLTQAQFQPIAIGERLSIVPSWHDPAPAPDSPDAVVVRLDPGVAFGTGTHPTTQLCLRWLESNLQSGQSVIDFGCGSGILAIAAKKLGAGRVVGTDIDAQAIGASRANARDNQCDIEFTESSRFESPASDIVIANILSNPLKLLAPLLAALVRPGGALMLSGILARQSDELIGVYRPFIALEVWAAEDGWVCLAGRAEPAA